MSNRQHALKHYLAFVLAFVMAFTSVFAVGTPASAKKKATATSIKVGKKSLSVQVGASKTVKVTVKGKKKTFTAKSSSSAAKVKVTGKKVKITGKSAGSAKITVTTKGKNSKGKKLSATIRVTVLGEGGTNSKATATPAQNSASTQPTNAASLTPAVQEVTSVTLNLSNTTLAIGVSAQITATVLPENATDKTLTFKSSNSGVASVNSTGLVTAVSPGDTTITATASNGVSGQIKVFVQSVPVTGVQIKDSENGVKLTTSGSTQLTEIVSPADATNKSVTWTSSNPSVATVDAKGLVKAISAGDAEITVTTVDGGHKASVTVYVSDSSKESVDGLSMDVTSTLLDDYTDKSKSTYAIMAGTDVNVRVRLTNQGKGVGKQNVKLTMLPQYSYNLKDEDDNLYQIEGNTPTKTYQTDEDGYINFAISPTADYLTAKPTDGYVQSFEIQASSGDYKSTATLRFGSVDIWKSIILNGEDPEDYEEAEGLNPIVPGLNAQKAGQSGTAYVDDADDDSIQYVTSQQTSTSNVDHSVYAYAAPFIMLSPSLQEVRSGSYEEKLDTSKYTSDSYSVYNDETNETTTKTIKRIPAGLKYATLKFDKIVLSEYTRMDINFFEILEDGSLSPIADSTVHMYPDAIDADALEVQIPDNVIAKTHDVCVVVSLKSEGQVNAKKNEGYILKAVVGEWKSQEVTKPTYNALKGYTSWEKDASFGRSTTNGKGKSYTLTSDEARKYLPVNEDEDYLAADNTYSYKVPSFPHVGNAIITVKGTASTWQFTYPIVNEDNANDIMPYSSYIGKAVLISEDEANNAVGDVSSLQNKSIVKVDSTKTGYTALHATIDISDLSGLKDEDVSSRVFNSYSYIQWAPYAIEEEEAEATDFYALKGQNVAVVGQLYDANGNVVTQSGKEVTFMQDGKNITDELMDYITTSGFTPKSDGSGQIKFNVRNVNNGTEVKDILERLSAKSEAYKVRFKIGDQSTATETEIATIHWVQPGLYFKNQVDIIKKGEQTVYGDAVTCYTGSKNVEALEHKVGTEWIYGLKTIGKLPSVDENAGYSVDRIDGIQIDYKQQGSGTVVKGNNTFTISNETISVDTITGAIDENSVQDTARVKFYIMKDDVVTEYTNVGTGVVSGLDAKIVIPIQWVKNGLNVKVATATGKTTMNVDNATELYVTVTDDYDNRLPDEEVSYTIKRSLGAIDAVTDQTIITNESGVATIPLAAPGMSGSVDVSVKVGTVTVDYQITYNTTQSEEFELDSVTADSTQGTLTLTFNHNVLETSIDKGEFTVSNTTLSGESAKFRISKVERTKDDEITISLEDSDALKNIADLSIIQVQIGEYRDDTGVKHELQDTDNRTLDPVTMKVQQN